MLGYEKYVDLFSNGLNVVEMIYFLDKNNLYNNNIKIGCVIINITKVYNEDLQFPHASRGADTLSEAKGVFFSAMHLKSLVMLTRLLNKLK